MESHYPFYSGESRCVQQSWPALTHSLIQLLLRRVNLDKQLCALTGTFNQRICGIYSNGKEIPRPLAPLPRLLFLNRPTIQWPSLCSSKKYKFTISYSSTVRLMSFFKCGFPCRGGGAEVSPKVSGA